MSSPLNYQFQNPDLLDTALTHRSFLNEASAKESNERLEFLGDAVLEVIVSEYLYTTFPDNPEGVRGAVYLDGGFSASQDFVSTNLFPLAQEILKGDLKDPKSLLQEKVQE